VKAPDSTGDSPSEAISWDQVFLDAIQIRAFEEVLLENFSELNIRGTCHTSIGQEITAVLISKYLNHDDFIFGTHRSHGIYLSLTKNFRGLYAEIMGIVGGTSNGIGGSQHLNSANFYTNGIQGGMVPVTVGAAFRRKDSGDSLGVCIVGDGTFGSGVLYESLNLAVNFKVPFLMIVEDNEISQSTPTRNVISGNTADKLKAFGLQVYEAATSDTRNLDCAISSAFFSARKMKNQVALIVKSDRLGPHSKGDDNRSKDELTTLRKRDSLESLMQSPYYLSFYRNCKQEFFSLLLDLSKQEINRNVPKDYAELIFPIKLSNPSEQKNGNIRNLTYEAIKIVLKEKPDSIMVGEDIEHIPMGTHRPYGGAFGVSRDLSTMFPGRVVNSAISEASLVGLAIGRSLAGHETIVEIMFGDFSTLIVDQIIQQASKIVGMYGSQKELPMMVRTPMGGRRGYGPTHSQNIEGLFFGLPNIVVYAQNVFFHERHFLELLQLGLPVMVIEHKDLYGKHSNSITNSESKIEYQDNGLLHLGPISGESSGIIICYGFAASIVLEATEEVFERFDKSYDVLILTIVSPLDLSQQLNMFKSKKVALLIEETDAARGLAGLILKEFSKLNLNIVLKTCSGNGMIGASNEAEEYALLNVEKVKRAILGL